MNRRGFSLLELLIALGLTSLVALMAWSILQRAAFQLRDRSERIGLEHALRVGSLAGRALLEPLGEDSTAGADLALAAPDGLVARAVRGSGVVCAAGTDSLTVRSGPGWWTELRAPSGGRDSVMVGTVAGPDHWIVTALDAGPVSGTCPDGTPARVFLARLVAADLAAVGPGSPVRVFEPIELRAYSSGGAIWLGMRGAGSAGSIQPLAGPFAGGGVQFSYYSRAGAGVTASGGVSRAGLVITAVTERAAGVGIARAFRIRSDSAGGSILLRNAP
ncbi:MAG TPA: prepilin-type N-terminal cleavage/methylation domain-containing protein [Gemmatimonadales bacterium]|nr:prepilin-type N-terminal cleavage/methylation domain-containing protein [Gemmatimonadales bacterium]